MFSIGFWNTCVVVAQEVLAERSEECFRVLSFGAQRPGDSMRMDVDGGRKILAELPSATSWARSRMGGEDQARLERGRAWCCQAAELHLLQNAAAA